MINSVTHPDADGKSDNFIDYKTILELSRVAAFS